MESEKKFSIENKEGEPKKIIVEIGPGDRPLISRIPSSKEKTEYRAGKEDKEVFDLKSGDTFIEVDLPPEQSIDVFRHWAMHDKSGNQSHLTQIKEMLDKRLPDGVKGEVVHADAQKLPFSDNSLDVVFMANVISGHVKNDQMGGVEATQRQILREKQNLIKEIKRVLRTGGSLIIEEEFPPDISGITAWNKVIEELQQDRDFYVQILEDFQKEDDRLVLKLTKRVRNPKGELAANHI